MSKSKERMSFYEYHGLLVASEGPKETRYDCPFCGGEGKLSANNETGQYRCLKPNCNKTGNRITFMRELIDMAEEYDYDELIDLKPALTAKALARVGVFVHPLRNLWCLPTYNGKNKLGNLMLLFQFTEEDKEVAQWRGSPDMGVQLLGCERIKKRITDVHLFEGVWDYLAALSYFGNFRDAGTSLVRTLKHSESMAMHMNICGVPGAGVYPDSFADSVGGRDVFAYYDNDDAGREGVKKVAKFHSTSAVDWSEINPELPKGYDFSDFINDEGKSAWSKLQKVLRPVEVSAIDTAEERALVQPIICDNYEAVREEFANAFHFTRAMDDALVTSLAVAASTPMPGTQLFLRIIGPAGSGKTVIAEALTLCRDWVISRSEVTGFHSGVNTTGVPMIEKMNGKTFIIKEADTLMSSKSKDTVLPQLRDIFDGASRVEYRTGVTSVHENLRITFILCGTDLVRRLNRAHLGDRFIDIEIYDREQDPSRYVDMAAENMLNYLNNGKPMDEDEINSDRRMHAAQLAAGYLLWMRSSEEFHHFKPILPPEIISKVKSLAYLLSFIRARDLDDDEIFTRSEVPTRLSEQFIRLIFFVAKVLGTEKVTARSRAYKIVKQVMFDTGRSYLLETFKLLAENGEMTVKELSDRLVFVQTHRINAALKNMRHFGIVESRQVRTGKRGRQQNTWKLSEKIQYHWDNI